MLDVAGGEVANGTAESPVMVSKELHEARVPERRSVIGSLDTEETSEL